MSGALLFHFMIKLFHHPFSLNTGAHLSSLRLAEWRTSTAIDQSKNEICGKVSAHTFGLISAYLRWSVQSKDEGGRRVGKLVDRLVRNIGYSPRTYLFIGAAVVRRCLSISPSCKMELLYFTRSLQVQSSTETGLAGRHPGSHARTAIQSIQLYNQPKSLVYSSSSSFYQQLHTQ